jgi:hypothetical protein
MGDNCLSPDHPIETARILGVVIARETVHGWLPAEPSSQRPLGHRVIRFLTLQAVKAALRIDTTVAGQLARFLSWLESLLRAPVGAGLRSLRSTPRR